jgi:type VI secretion system protein VasD
VRQRCQGEDRSGGIDLRAKWRPHLSGIRSLCSIDRALRMDQPTLTRQSPSLHRRHFLIGSTGLVLAGCASAPRPPVVVPLTDVPAILVVTMRAGTDINPDIRGQPSALAVRLFELKSATLFAAADFFALYEREQATLAGELLGSEQVILAPGATRTVSRTLPQEARFLGVIAAFRELDRSVWRDAVPIARSKVQVGAAGGVPVPQRVSLVCERASIRFENS